MATMMTVKMRSKLQESRYETWNVPIKGDGDLVEGRPQHNPFATTPKGYRLFTSFTGWEEGDAYYLVPVGAKFVCVYKGSLHSASVWEIKLT